MTTAPRLRIGTLRLRTRLAMPANSALRQPALARVDLAGPLHAELQPLLGNGDSSVWLIRRLDVRALADAGTDPATALARAVRLAVERALSGDGDGVRHFPDRPARLAAFLVDLANGDAFDRWYHARWRHLAALPLAQALRLAIADDSEQGLAALVALAADARLARLIDRISTAGAYAVLAALLTPHPASAATIDPDVITALAADEPMLRRWAAGPQAMLLLTIAVARQTAAPLPAIAAAVAAALPAMFAASAAPPAAPRHHPAMTPRPSTKYPARPPAVPRYHPRTALAITSQTPIFTGFAGIFLLWRSATELGLTALLATPAVRLHFAAALAGPDRDAAFADPALHWLAGHIPQLGEPDPRPPPPLAIARLLAAAAAPRRPALVRQVCGKTHVLQDAASEDWLAVGSARTIGRIVKALQLGRPGPAAADARPATADIAHFAAAPAWRVPARAAHADLARRLPGLARSSAAYVAGNLVAGAGRLEIAADGPRVILPNLPLDLVLRMTGIDGTRVDLGDSRHFRLMLPGAA